MKRLMVLGAGYTQIPLYEAARQLGVHTIAASIPGSYPGFSYADECVYADISDPDAVTKAAAACRADGIATCGLDLGMRAIGQACEILHLPGPAMEAAGKASDKFEMKKALRSSGVQTARFYCVHNETELEEAMNHLAFPVILKAVDLMGSRGIYRSDTRDEARQNFRRSMQETRKDYCLIEEFIEGELFGAEAMIQNGKLLFIHPDNTDAFLSTTPTPIGHSIPFRDEEMLGEQVRRQVEAAVKAIGLDNCPVNCDLMKKDGRVYIIELTGRSGATGLSEMTGAWFGCNYYEVIVRLALGEDVSRFFDHPTGTAFLSHTLISRRTGRVRQIINHNLPQPEVRDLSFNIRAGDEVRSYTNGRDRIGQVMIQGKSLDQCEQKLQEVLRNIHIVLEGDPEE